MCMLHHTGTTIGALINGATTKTLAVDADYLGLMDSEGSNVLKKLSWAYVKSILKTYFDTQYTGGASVPSATAESDFIVAGATPFAWVKKTLAEVKTILGLVLTFTAQSVGFTISGGATSKTLTIGADASVSGTNTGDSSTPAETTATIGTMISGATPKTTPIDADNFGYADSAATNILKSLTWANIKAALKTYFDTLYTGGASIPSATAESDFIIAGASPFAWAKKTLAEAKTILGLVLTQTSQTIGFTLSGGATSKTLTVALDASVSGTNTGDSAGHTTLVAGPASAVDGKVVLFDGTTGKLVKDSGLSLSGSNTGDSATPAETTTTIGALINGATAKTSAVDADYLPLMDSEATNIMKKLSWAYVKSVLKT